MPKADGSTVQAALAAIADRTSAGKGEAPCALVVVQGPRRWLQFCGTHLAFPHRNVHLKCGPQVAVQTLLQYHHVCATCVAGLYSKFLAIGLFRLLELVGAKDPKALESVAKSLSLRPEAVNRDLLTYKARVGLRAHHSHCSPWKRTLPGRRLRRYLTRVATVGLPLLVLNAASFVLSRGPVYSVPGCAATFCWKRDDREHARSGLVSRLTLTLNCDHAGRPDEAEHGEGVDEGDHGAREEEAERARRREGQEAGGQGRRVRFPQCRVRSQDMTWPRAHSLSQSSCCHRLGCLAV